MIFPVSKRSLILSLLGHFFVFLLFGVSLGKRLPCLDYPRVNFWGAILMNTEIIKINKITTSNEKRILQNNLFKSLLFEGRLNRQPLFLIDKGDLLKIDSYLDKPVYLSPDIVLRKPVLTKRDLFLYPVLPQHFLIYFRDRQKIYVSLSFNFITKGEGLPLLSVRRNKSSGNLEIDLLAMRYLTYYLFRLKNLTLNQWHEVNIELSKKE